MEHQVAANSLLDCLSEKLQKWVSEQGIPEDHGFEHYKRVYEHALRAIAVDFPHLSAEHSLAVLVAALLHDVNDRKLEKWLRPFLWSLVQAEQKEHGADDADATTFFVDWKTLPIARWFLKEVKVAGVYGEQVVETICRIISLVSTSTNGDQKVAEPWMAIVRDADRVEASGLTGIRRCYQYTVHAQRPIANGQTPLPCTEHTLEDVMRGRTLNDFVRKGGHSSTMVDHFYEKLLHLNRAASGSSYLQGLLNEGVQLQREWLLRTNEFLLTHFTSKDIMAGVSAAQVCLTPKNEVSLVSSNRPKCLL